MLCRSFGSMHQDGDDDDEEEVPEAEEEAFDDEQQVYQDGGGDDSWLNSSLDSLMLFTTLDNDRNSNTAGSSASSSLVRNNYTNHTAAVDSSFACYDALGLPRVGSQQHNSSCNNLLNNNNNNNSSYNNGSFRSSGGGGAGGRSLEYGCDHSSETTLDWYNNGGSKSSLYCTGAATTANTGWCNDSSASSFDLGQLFHAAVQKQVRFGTVTVREFDNHHHHHKASMTRRRGGEKEEDHLVDDNCANLPRRQTRDWNQIDVVKWLPPLMDIAQDGSEATKIVDSIPHQPPQCPATTFAQPQQRGNRLAVFCSWTSPPPITATPRRPPRSLSSSLKAESFSATTDHFNAEQLSSSVSSLRTIREAPEVCQKRDHAKVA